jgi:pyridoxamine 5'-phosphate oxidase
LHVHRAILAIATFVARHGYNRGMMDWMQELRLVCEAEYRARPIVATMATANRDGQPHARIVIVRLFDPGEGILWIATDRRSEKINELAACPVAELVFWAPQERHQFRVRGRVSIVTAGVEREEIWAGMKARSRAMFLWPPPGEPRCADGDFAKELDGEGPIPDTFVALSLKATEVDSLELNETPHRRRRWRASENWQVEAINP